MTCAVFVSIAQSYALFCLFAPVWLVLTHLAICLFFLLKSKIICEVFWWEDFWSDKAAQTVVHSQAVLYSYSSLSQWWRAGSQELNPSLLGDNLETNRVKSTSVPCDLWVIRYILTKWRGKLHRAGFSVTLVTLVMVYSDVCSSEMNRTEQNSSISDCANLNRFLVYLLVVYLQPETRPVKQSNADLGLFFFITC